MVATQKVKRCFIITPIGAKRSTIRDKAKGVIDAVLTPVLKEIGYEIINPMEGAKPGSISDQIINDIIDAELVVANITGLNPNVMYELAIRHATNKPVITIAQDNTKPPFDIYNDRVIYYEDSMVGSRELKSQFTEAVLLVQLQDTIDNPINRAIDGALLRKKARTSIEKHLLRNSDLTVSYLSRLAYETGLDHTTPGIGMQVEYKIKPRSSNNFDKLMASIHASLPMNIISIEHATYHDQKVDGHLFFRYKGFGNTQSEILKIINDFGLIIVKAYILDDVTNDKKIIHHHTRD